LKFKKIYNIKNKLQLFFIISKMDSKNEAKRGKKISTKELKDDDFFKEKADLKIILIGDSAVGKSK
jgi:hypothetical protein